MQQRPLNHKNRRYLGRGCGLPLFCVWAVDMLRRGTWRCRMSLLPLKLFPRPLPKSTPLPRFERIPDQQLFADRLQKAAVGPTPRIIVAAEAAQIEH